MPTILPPAPSATLAPSGTLTPSSSTFYIDAPTGVIGGTLVVGGGGIVKVGGSSVNQEPQRRQPRVYPQQAPSRLIHISYQIGHDAPTGTLRLTGTASDSHTRPTFRVHAGHWPGEPTIDDVIKAQRHVRREITRIREKAGQA